MVKTNMKVYVFLSVVGISLLAYCFFIANPSSSGSSGFSATTQSVARCGNGVVEGTEECDGHDADTGLYCNEDCTSMLLE